MLAVAINNTQHSPAYWRGLGADDAANDIPMGRGVDLDFSERHAAELAGLSGEQVSDAEENWRTGYTAALDVMARHYGRGR